MNDSSSIIAYHAADVAFALAHEDHISAWLVELAQAESCSIDHISYIFCSDDYLLGINKEYLNHDYYTDIITFPLSNDQNAIQSDIYISVDRVKDNAKSYSASFRHELYRVMAHGLLHLCGYGDATDDERAIMRSKEEDSIKKVIEMLPA